MFLIAIPIILIISFALALNSLRIELIREKEHKSNIFVERVLVKDREEFI